MCEYSDDARLYWHQHLGTVEFIWPDGHTIIKPIGSAICGLTRTIEDGTVLRYIDYKLNVSEDVAKSLNAVEHAYFLKWLRYLVGGLDRTVYESNYNKAWYGAHTAWKDFINEQD